LTFTPGKQPFHRLAAALVATWEPDKNKRPTAGEALGNHFAEGMSFGLSLDQALSESPGTDRLLVVVDQFEELFTQTPVDQRGPFVARLLDAAAGRPVTLLLTLRADFYAQAIGVSRALSDAIERGVVNVGAMTRDELTRAIEEPARRIGRTFQPGLVDRLLDEVAGEPGNLPLLEFALTRLWGETATSLLSHEGYDAIGGVGKAIGARAEELYGNLSPADQAAALRAFGRLVHVSSAEEAGTDTRQRVRLSDLDDDARRVVETFVAARLLTAGHEEGTKDRPVVEVAHEAVIRNWDRLTDFVSKNRPFFLWRQRLGGALAEWERSGRDPGALLQGPALRTARQWARKTSDLNAAERDFIARSAAAPSTAVVLAASALLLGLLVAGAVYGWYAYTRTDAYQLSRVYAAAPDLVASTSRGHPDVVVRWAETLVFAGRAGDALQVEVAVEDVPTAVRVADAIAQALARTGDSRRARSVADAAFRKADLTPVPLSRAGGLSTVAGTFVALGDGGAAEKVAVEALGWLRAMPNSQELDRRKPVQAEAAMVLARLGRTDKALDVAVALSDDYVSSKILGACGRVEKPGPLLDALAAAMDRKPALDPPPVISHPVEVKEQRVRFFLLASEALAKDGQREGAIAAARRARDSARAVEGLSERCLALAQTAYQLATLAEVKDAASLADEAETALARRRTGFQDKPPSDHSRTGIETATGAVAVALAWTGRMDKAFGLAGTIGDESHVSGVLDTMAAKFESWGQVEQSLRLLSEAYPRRTFHPSFFSRIVDVIVARDFVATAQQFVSQYMGTGRLSVDFLFHDQVCSELAQALARHDRAESGLEVAEMIQDRALKEDALAVVAAGLASHRMPDEAERALKGFDDLSKLNQGRRQVALNLVNVGLTADALRIARLLDSDEARSSVYNAAAKRFAAEGDLARARETADLCLSSDRLDAYDAIVRSRIVVSPPVAAARP
jgi:hypothetical protein